MTTTTAIEGKNWYAKTYRINSATDYVNFVFSTGSGSPQTVDVNNINSDTFFEISSQTDGGKNLVNIIPAGITQTQAQPAIATADIYSIDGRLIRKGTPGQTLQQQTEGLPSGIYIVGKQKLVVR